MQAIASDIIVNQAVKNGSIQISQTINTSSSSNVSFSDMLASLQKKEESVQFEKADSQAFKPKADEHVEKPKEAEKDENLKDSENVKQKEKSVEKSELKDESENKKLSSKDEKNVQQKLNNSEEEILSDADKIKNVSSKTVNQTQKKESVSPEDKKAVLDKQKMNTLMEEAQQNNESELVKTVSSSAATAIVEFNNGAENPEEKIKVQNDKLTENISDIKADVLAKDYNLGGDAKIQDLDEKNKPKLSVIDLRTKPETDTEETTTKTSKTPVKIEYNSDNTATVTMEIDPQQIAASENILSLNNQTAAANGSDFQTMVNNQIQASVPDFVRTGTILLKDNNKGTINLVLHPDDIGNVKIHLSMDGKTISAHITVNTKEALEVFKDNAQTLREAFAKNGYETAGFDVSYNGSSNSQGQNQNFEGKYNGMEYIARNAYSDFAGVQDDGYIQNGWENEQNSEYSINIVA